MIKRGVAIVHYNRTDQLGDLIECTKLTVPNGTRVVVCDDGSDRKHNEDNTIDEAALHVPHDVSFIRGPNKGVGANKNRALWALQDCHFMAIIEDDLFPMEKGWFEIYERTAEFTDNHHFCRVQSKEIRESHPTFTESLAQQGITPIFASSPRGDFTFITSRVITTVGGFNPRFQGAGYAHGEWSNRIANAGLVCHPLRWWDIKEARDKFEQRGDTDGGRWNLDKGVISTQLRRNKRLLTELQKTQYIYHPLVLE